MIMTGYIVGVVASIVTLLTFHLYVHREVINVFYALHFSFLGLLVGSFLFIKNKKVFLTLVTLSTVIFVFGYNYALYRVIQLQDFQRFLHVCLGLVAITSFTIQLLPLTGWYGFTAISLYMSGIYFATASEPRGIVIAGIFGMVLGFSFVVRQRLYITSINEAKREFLLRSQIAPAQIIRKTMGDTSVDFVEAFAPEVNFCVCISTDWRRYQQMSQKISNHALSTALSNYYDLCESLLEGVAPLGNYYSDWIADELFVVMYLTKAETKQSLVRTGIRFTSNLVRAKQKFYEEHGLPDAIDVGVSCGHALIGMMGPKTYKKATALGVIPGRSRRYQQLGKQMRKSYYHADRVIFDEKIRDYIVDDAYDVFSVEAKILKKGAKDIYEATYYYLEPAGKKTDSEEKHENLIITA